MVKIDSEVDSKYGLFVKNRAKKFIPYDKRENNYYVYDNINQKIVDDYRQKEKDWQERQYHHLERRKSYVSEKLESDTKTLAGIISFVLFLVIFGSATADGWDDTEFPASLFVAVVAYLIIGPVLSNIDLHFLQTYHRKRFELKHSLEPIPTKPSNYPDYPPDIRKTTIDTKNDEDQMYEVYLDKKKRYKTEADCPICNNYIWFSVERKVPFKGKCKACNYSFTFVYKKFVERYYITETIPKKKKTAHYLEYDGIKPTRPRSPSKGGKVSGTKRKSISQDVRDKVWNRDGGKCIECGSNKDLEFDHIIPFSKGGANTYRNLQLLCEECNRSKSDEIG